MRFPTSSLRLAALAATFATLTSACAVHTTTSDTPPDVVKDTADVATRYIEVDASAQTYGGDLAVYARLSYAFGGGLPLGAGDALIATVAGKSRALVINAGGDYTATFPMPASAEDVEIRFERPTEKSSASLVVRVPAAFRLVSPPSTLNADAPIVFHVDPPLPEGATATVRVDSTCFSTWAVDPLVLTARGAADGTVTLDPSVFDNLRGKDVDINCRSLVGVRFETHDAPSVGFAKASVSGLEERGYQADVHLAKGK